MKILLFTEVHSRGGIETFLLNLINHWPREADSFILAANADYPGLNHIEEDVSRPCKIVRHSLATYEGCMPTGGLGKALWKAFSPISRYLLLGYQIFRLKRLMQESDAERLVIVNGGYPGGDSCRAAAIAWALVRGRPYSIHSFHGIPQAAPWHRRLQERIVDRLLCRFTSSFVTVSRAASEAMACRPEVYKVQKPLCIHNGIVTGMAREERTGAARSELGIPASAPLCLMLGAYEPYKGHHFLLKAFAEVLKSVPEAHLLICGFETSYKEQVRRWMEELRLGRNVHLTGFRKDLSRLFAAADVLVISSQEPESFGLTSVEAMARGVPVVATRVGGIPEVVVDGEGGYCVAQDDVLGFAERVTELLLNRGLRQEQGQNGSERVRRLFSAEGMAAKYCRLINMLATEDLRYA